MLRFFYIIGRFFQWGLVVLWLLLHPLISFWCFIQARKAGMRSWPWVLLALFGGVLTLPLFLNHRRMAQRRAAGLHSFIFRP